MPNGKKLNTNEFIERSLIIHGNKYDYSVSDYKGYHNKILMICKIHGKFLQTAGEHLKGHGCRKCAEKTQSMLKTSSVVDFIKKAKKFHGNKYDYSNTIYKNSCTLININCRKHGQFLQRPCHHIRGRGCPTCGLNNSILKRKKDINMARKVRIATIKRIEKNKLNGNQLVPNFNPNACKIIDEYGKRNEYNFQHAMNGGEFYIKELGYWVDGYDKENNIVLEIDEKQHFDKNGKLKPKDIKRMNEIKKFLDCKFIRINLEKYNAG